LVLRAVDSAPGSATEIARRLGWTYGQKGEPYRMRVARAAENLKSEKLIEEVRGVLRLTPKGHKELNLAGAPIASNVVQMPPANSNAPTSSASLPPPPFPPGYGRTG
jgi:hypothetical protein